jgi:hypothetical protein
MKTGGNPFIYNQEVAILARSQFLLSGLLLGASFIGWAQDDSFDALSGSLSNREAGFQGRSGHLYGAQTLWCGALSGGESFVKGRPPADEPRAHARGSGPRRCSSKEVSTVMNLASLISLALVVVSIPWTAGVVLAQGISARGEELKFVVIVTRHGVRPPTVSNDQINLYSAEPWPKTALCARCLRVGPMRPRQIRLLPWLPADATSAART